MTLDFLSTLSLNLLSYLWNTSSYTEGIQYLKPLFRLLHGWFNVTSTCPFDITSTSLTFISEHSLHLSNPKYRSVTMTPRLVFWWDCPSEHLDRIRWICSIEKYLLFFVTHRWVCDLRYLVSLAREFRFFPYLSIIYAFKRAQITKRVLCAYLEGAILKIFTSCRSLNSLVILCWFL